MLKKQPRALHKSLCRGWFAFVVIVASAAGAHSKQPFLGPIPVQFVAPGQEVVLDMHRFFQPGSDITLNFKTTDDVALNFDPTAFELRVRPQKRGIFDIELSRPSGKGRLTTVLTVAATSGPPPHRFSFKPAAPATKIYLSGSFNGWSSGQLCHKPPASPNPSFTPSST